MLDALNQRVKTIEVGALADQEVSRYQKIFEQAVSLSQTDKFPPVKSLKSLAQLARMRDLTGLELAKARDISTIRPKDKAEKAARKIIWEKYGSLLIPQDIRQVKEDIYRCILKRASSAIENGPLGENDSALFSASKQNLLSSSPAEHQKENRAVPISVSVVSSPMMKPQQEVIQNILCLLNDKSIKQKIKDLFGQEDVISSTESFTIWGRFSHDEVSLDARHGSRLKEDPIQIIFLYCHSEKPGLLLFPGRETQLFRHIEFPGEPGAAKSLNTDCFVIEEGRKILFKEYISKYIKERFFSEFKFEYRGSGSTGNIAVEQGGFFTKGVTTDNYKIYDKSNKRIVIENGIIIEMSCQFKLFCPVIKSKNEEVVLTYHTHLGLFYEGITPSIADFSHTISNFKYSQKPIPEMIIGLNRKARIYILKDILPIEQWNKPGGYPKEEEIARYFHIIEIEFSREGGISRWEEIEEKGDGFICLSSPLEEGRKRPLSQFYFAASSILGSTNLQNSFGSTDFAWINTTFPPSLRIFLASSILALVSSGLESTRNTNSLSGGNFFPTSGLAITNRENSDANSLLLSNNSFSVILSLRNKFFSVQFPVIFDIFFGEDERFIIILQEKRSFVYFSSGM
ncbi:MAG TPA: hypothetical protein DCL49_00415, partial [Candidatus Omnitrophica bacterium]|nr:hypothetical protein [Candidatus Omnitrophota bacterium]